MNKEKWHYLAIGAEFDRYRVPIYDASAKNKCIPLLKTLMSSYCSNNCKFCAFRNQRRTRRLRWKPEELAKVTMKLWKEQEIKGLFLSSGLDRDPEKTTEQQLEVVRLLRKQKFKGYIHFRAMPGIGFDKIKEASKLSDRIGINLEAPSREIYDEIKVSEIFDYKQGILKRMRWIAREYRKLDNSKPFGNLRAGIDTQFIVGATQDNDRDILKVTNQLYKELDLRRVYYSGFEPVPNTPLEDHQPCPKEREHRLYQASFLLREYKFSYKDLVYDENENLINQDPKLAFAQSHPEYYPINVNSASYGRLLLIPGIGPITANKIIQHGPFSYLADLRKIVGRRINKSLKYMEIPNNTKIITLNEWLR